MPFYTVTFDDGAQLQFRAATAEDARNYAEYVASHSLFPRTIVRIEQEVITASDRTSQIGETRAA